MGGCEWVYKYIFTSKILNIAVIKNVSWARNQRKEYKLPRILIEYKGDGCWHQIGLFK